MKRNGPDENRAAAVAAETTPARIAGSPVKDRWHQLQDLIEASNMPAADTTIYKYLLGKSDYRSAELEPRWTPTREKIEGKPGYPAAGPLLSQAPPAARLAIRPGAAQVAVHPGRDQLRLPRPGPRSKCSGCSGYRQRHSTGPGNGATPQRQSRFHRTASKIMQRMSGSRAFPGRRTRGEPCLSATGCNQCTKIGATHWCNAAGQRARSTGRQREGSSRDRRTKSR